MGKEGKILSEHGALLGKEGWGRRPQQVVGGLKSSEQKTGWQGGACGRERETERQRERDRGRDGTKLYSNIDSSVVWPAAPTDCTAPAGNLGTFRSHLKTPSTA